ncbi:ankyrin repeat domain-containing protein 12 [Drosophila ficusphila]|uniref:ankyrin repeat domain-containing protein 12 n=1 Tax=Drosophila ficusphila TaxID=30025 RepID=UPI0007E5EF0B|nr:ankyrin repeat domain-containing protein 12 [Drosophila ficusphila]XP_017043103.1 ankyrin repeat domain-containing protein 12 [Drosophila ficusphila]
MPPPRPKGIGFNTGATQPRSNSNTPMSERQQMALLIQMTATSSTDSSRTNLKKNESKKGETEIDESSLNEKPEVLDPKDKSSAEESSNDGKNSDSIHQGTSAAKRCYSDIEEDYEESGEDVKKKKRKDSEHGKDLKGASLKLTSRVEKGSKLATAKGSPSGNKSSASSADKEQAEISKNVDIENETECSDDYKSNDSLYNGGLKVPPLKIVIPQQNCSIDTEGNVLRTGKVTASRNAALPYVVSSNSDSIDTVITNQSISPHESPQKSNSICSTVLDDKNIKLFNDEKNLRVLRSSHRTGVTSVERSSNNSSPQMQSSSPSPASSNHANDPADVKLSYSNMTSSPIPQGHQFDQETITNVPSPSTSSTSSSKEINPSSNVELHPRKRKIRPKNTDDSSKNSNAADSGVNSEESHPHDHPFTNGFQMFLSIRRQIEKKWKSLYPVKPRPPQGYNEYLLTKKSYLLSRNAETSAPDIPRTVPQAMERIYQDQEKARQDLIQAHTVEREKLCLNVEQEIIRVHSKAARSISGQPAPYSVCTYLKDDEVYNMITPEQDEKEKSARCRFNGRLLLSWLQDVDDKWEKIKESMVLRHHNEAESLRAVQVMDWNIFAKRNRLCDHPTEVNFEHVPIVSVGNDFDTLPT